MRVLVTGANGFIGKNLIETLNRIPGFKIFKFDKENSLDEIEGYINEIDFIFHLAGINRPKDNSEFYQGNRDLTKSIIELIEKNNLKIPILITSSIQAEKDNDYGKSKLEAEKILEEYSKKNFVAAYIYRLPNVFGKWSRPNYNSAVATWCYNIANDLEIAINNRDTELSLVYIDDVVKSFVHNLTEPKTRHFQMYYEIPTVYKIKLGELAEMLYKFKENRKNLIIPKVGSGIERVLYATYLSFLPKDDFSYTVPFYSDERGSFVELIKTIDCGQFSISTSKPGVTRGNHYHNTKNEKFIVIKGQAKIRFRQIESTEVIEYDVSDKKIEIVDIPVGYTHNITNTGDTEMVLAVWANELFDKENPDTYYVEV